MRLYPKNYEGEAPREFGIDANILKVRTFDLTRARNLEEIEIGGSCLWAVSGSFFNSYVDIRINDQLRDPLRFQRGMFIRGIPFSRVFISHAAQANQVLTVFFAVEEEVNNIHVVNPSVTGLDKSSQMYTMVDVSVGAGALENIQASNPARRVMWLTNLTGNAETFRVGDITIHATRGVPLAPGETITLETADAVYVYNPAAAIDQSIAVMWTED